jgi:predicted GIY-YIG superfamily endonuclease
LKYFKKEFKIKMSKCYILKLENNKYYVGISNNIEQRMISHFSEEGSKWTKLHKPIEIIEIKDNTHKWQETYTTIITMKKYGIENVRGGPYSTVEFFYRPNIELVDEKLSIEENYVNYKKYVGKNKSIDTNISSSSSSSINETDSSSSSSIKTKFSDINKSSFDKNISTSNRKNSSNTNNSFSTSNMNNSIELNFDIFCIKSNANKYYITSNNKFEESKFFGEQKISNVITLKKNSNNRKEIYAFTILYMFKYGIDNVRGGGITTLNLSKTYKDKYNNYFQQMNENSTIEDVLKIIEYYQ